MATTTIDALADRLFAAFMAHDYGTVRAVCAPDAIAWSNLGNVEQDVAALIAFMPLMRAGIGDHTYGDVRRMAVDGGFVEQHRVTSVKPDGSTLDLGDVCVVVKVDGEGRVTRLDEYLDTAHVNRTLGLT